MQYIRTMRYSDADKLCAAFAAQGRGKPLALFRRYYREQKAGKRQMFIAIQESEVAGYATLIARDPQGPFADQAVPTIRDLNVLERFQGQGLGRLLMDAMENEARRRCDRVALAVGLHSGYGRAQRMYVRRGYQPDGSGVWYRGKPLPADAECRNDDELNLYLLKQF